MTVALIKDGAVIEYRYDSAVNVDQNALSANKPRLVPVVEENEKYNYETQERDGPTVIVEQDRVIWRYIVRPKVG